MEIVDPHGLSIRLLVNLKMMGGNLRDERVARAAVDSVMYELAGALILKPDPVCTPGVTDAVISRPGEFGRTEPWPVDPVAVARRRRR